MGGGGGGGVSHLGELGVTIRGVFLVCFGSLLLNKPLKPR